MIICIYCNKIFSNKSNLVKHQNTRLCIQNQSQYQIEKESKYKLEEQTKKIQEQSEKIEAQTKQIQEQTEQLNHALAQIQELKEDNIKLKTRLEIYSEQKQEFPSTHTTNNTTNNITIINQLQVLDLNPKSISRLAFRHFSLDYLKQENKGVANFTINHVIRDSNGKPNYICTDPSRKIGKYKSTDDNIVTDFGMTTLSDTVYNSIKNAVQSLVMQNIVQEGTSRDDNRYYKHERKLNKNSPDFTNEIVKAVYSRNIQN